MLNVLHNNIQKRHKMCVFVCACACVRIIPQWTVLSVPRGRCHRVLAQVFALPGWQTWRSPTPASPLPVAQKGKLGFLVLFTLPFKGKGLLLIVKHVQPHTCTNKQLHGDSFLTDQPVRWRHIFGGAPVEAHLPQSARSQAKYTGTADYSVHHCETKNTSVITPETSQRHTTERSQKY